MKSRKLIWPILIIAVLGIAFTGLFAGRFSISPSVVLKLLLGSAGEEFVTERQIVYSVRMPRVLLSLLVGCGLAVSGASFQGIFQNPLVSPDVLSVSSGAAFGAVLAILLNTPNSLLTVLALCFGLLSVFITYWFSKIGGKTNTLSLVLSGMIMSALFNALVSLAKYVADTDTQLPAITYWLLGSMANASYADVGLIFLPVIGGTVFLSVMGSKINILSLGDEDAKALGMNPARSRILVILAATLVTASCITVTGIIGWVGLVIPHIARMLVGPDHTKLIISSALIGAGYLTLIDLVSRTVTAAEIPIGILTALIGAPFFAVIFKKTRGNLT